MEISKVLKLLLGIVLFICLLDFGFNLMTVPNAAANIAGLFIVVLTTAVLLKTEFLMNVNINFKKTKKDEK